MQARSKTWLARCALLYERERGMAESLGGAHRSGYVSLIGNPNVGKSTLMNRLVGERLSIVTEKAQTTRRRIFGIVDTPSFQIVYSDTPGILSPAYALQRTMLRAVEEALEDSDAILYITDVVEQPDKHNEVLQRIADSEVVKLLIINKIDLTEQKALEALVERWAVLMPGVTILPVSALVGFGVDVIQPKLVQLLPEGPKYFPSDTLTDRPVRFFVTEIIREKVLMNCRQEVPYSVEVVVRSYEEGEKLDRIDAVIYVSRESQKGILIGRGGSMLKRIGQAARRDIEAFVQRHVYLALTVQVAENWRDDDTTLRRFGYVE